MPDPGREITKARKRVRSSKTACDSLISEPILASTCHCYIRRSPFVVVKKGAGIVSGRRWRVTGPKLEKAGGG